MFKTGLDTFENDFGHFWIFENFLIFLKFFKTRPSMEHGAVFLSEKKPQNLFKTSLDNFGNNSVLFRTFEFPLIFLRKLSMTPWNTGQKKFRKNYPKTRLDTWERFWTILELWIFRHFFLEIFLSLYLKI